MRQPPTTLLGSAGRDSLVPFHPSHWESLRSRVSDTVALVSTDDAFAVTLDMAAEVRTVVINGRPECIIGLHLVPDGGSPWVMTAGPTVDRLARAVLVSRPFIAECLARCSLLRTEVEHFDSASFLWFAGLGFRSVTDGALTCWEMQSADEQGRVAIRNGDA